MRKMKRMVCAAGTDLMVCCMAGSTVSAAPVSDIEQQKSVRKSQVLMNSCWQRLRRQPARRRRKRQQKMKEHHPELYPAATREQAPAEIPEQHPAAPEAIVPAADLPVHPAEILLWRIRL